MEIQGEKQSHCPDLNPRAVKITSCVIGRGGEGVLSHTSEREAAENDSSSNNCEQKRQSLYRLFQSFATFSHL
jgi:hypothetical protein